MRWEFKGSGGRNNQNQWAQNSVSQPLVFAPWMQFLPNLFLDPSSLGYFQWSKALLGTHEVQQIVLHTEGT